MRSIQRRIVDRGTKNAWTREKKREAEKKKRRKRGRDNSVYNEGGIQIPAVPPGNERLTGNEREREREKTDIVVGRGEERRGWNAHKEADRGIYLTKLEILRPP